MVPCVTGNHQTLPEAKTRDGACAAPPHSWAPAKEKNGSPARRPSAAGNPSRGEPARVLPVVGGRGWHAGEQRLDEQSHPRARLDTLPEEEHALTCAVQEELLAVCQCLKQSLEWTRRGPFGPRPPIAPQHDPGLQPGTHGSQRSGPGHLGTPDGSCADFFAIVQCSRPVCSSLPTQLKGV
jgi:hypothetical protein